MNGDPATGIEDIVRRNVAALRSKANLTQQALADQMLLRGIAWTRETVAQVETTNRRLGFTEAIVVAACLDVPVARLTATGAATVVVGESEWTAAYLGAAIAGTTGDTFPPESYASPAARSVPAPTAAPPAAPSAAPPVAPSVARPGPPPAAPVPRPPTTADLVESTRPGPAEELPERRRGERRVAEPEVREQRGRRETDSPAQTPQKTAERIERRLRLRVTAGDVDATAQHLWSRSLEAERERRVTDRVALTGGSLKTIRGHVSRDLDREIAHEMERNPERVEAVFAPSGDVETVELGADEAAWEATRLNIALANKGYNDSDVTRWWNFTRHRELGDRTIAEAWKAAEYGAVRRLVESLPDKHGITNGYYSEE
ncbi:MAG: helix-turn-helix transcriptional regulator [Acidimicrobiales bacterium]|jgi:transcriptional regulator with XRE-family HTH domain